MHVESKINNIERSPPANIEAEQIVLGAILLNNEHLYSISEFMHAEYFYEPIHVRLYEAIHTLIEKGMSATPTSIKSMFLNDKQFEYVGKDEYLKRLVSSAMIVTNLYDYGRIIYDLAVRRKLILLGEDVVNIAYDSGIDHSSVSQIEEAEQKLFNLASFGINEKEFASIGSSISDTIEIIDKAMQSRDNVTGIGSGFVNLDFKLSGFQNSDLLILAGRPSMGKTALAISMALNCCKNLQQKNKDTQKPFSVGIFSLEMSSEQLITRLLSMETGINSTNLRTGRINEEQYNKLRKCAMEIGGMPIFIDDTPALTIAGIRARARRMKRKNNLSILFIDYLQLVKSATNKENRVLEISEITQGLKALAKELNIPIIALSQLSRAVEQREDKRPLLSDLRESGSIEQDSDIVMFIFREEYYLTRKEPDPDSSGYSEWCNKLNKVHNLAEVIIAKHRNGPIGLVQLFYDPTISKFTDYDF